MVEVSPGMVSSARLPFPEVRVIFSWYGGFSLD